jgi:hypothetical protein
MDSADKRVRPVVGVVLVRYLNRPSIHLITRSVNRTSANLPRSFLLCAIASTFVSSVVSLFAPSRAHLFPLWVFVKSNRVVTFQLEIVGRSHRIFVVFLVGTAAHADGVRGGTTSRSSIHGNWRKIKFFGPVWLSRVPTLQILYFVHPATAFGFPIPPSI